MPRSSRVEQSAWRLGRSVDRNSDNGLVALWSPAVDRGAHGAGTPRRWIGWWWPASRIPGEREINWLPSEDRRLRRVIGRGLSFSLAASIVHRERRRAQMRASQ
jgi:hypothetical protein